jgi:hypothetical protein
LERRDAEPPHLTDERRKKDVNVRRLAFAGERIARQFDCLVTVQRRPPFFRVRPPINRWCFFQSLGTGWRRGARPFTEFFAGGRRLEASNCRRAGRLLSHE